MIIRRGKKAMGKRQLGFDNLEHFLNQAESILYSYNSGNVSRRPASSRHSRRGQLINADN
jgi:hypothetical protein